MNPELYHLALRLAPYAAAAYDQPPDGADVCLDATASEVYLWTHSPLGCAVVAVRGSTSRLDWLANALSCPDDTGYHAGYGLGLRLPQRAYDGLSLQQELYRVLEERLDPDTPVLWTGHSRGAGEVFELAHRAPGWVHHRALVTFGAPCVYTRRACAAYDHHLGRLTLNVRNLLDPVPYLPCWRLRRPGTDWLRGWGHRMRFYALPLDRHSPEWPTS